MTDAIHFTVPLRAAPQGADCSHMSVSRAEQLHLKAMALSDMAFSSKIAGQSGEFRRLLSQAFDHERSAADSVAEMFDLEPTRSVLHRSAATLAIELGEAGAAEKLIHRALSGNAPDSVAEELRNLLEQVYFKRHLDLRGLELGDNEIQMAISGSGVGYGVAPTDQFISRVQGTEKLLYRIAERKSGRPYREHGQAPPNLRSDLALFMSAPRAASFAVTFRIGQNQRTLPGMDVAREIVDEFLEELELFNRQDEQSLRRRIPDEAYYRNFTGLARTIVPDGEEITQVGFTSLREGVRRDVALVRTRGAEVRPKKQSMVDKGHHRRFKGLLKAADAVREQRNQIKIVPEKAGVPLRAAPQGSKKLRTHD